jgi:hypothetical protein
MKTPLFLIMFWPNQEYPSRHENVYKY